MKKRLFSIFMALTMVLGVLVAPFNVARAENEKVTKTVTLHKLVMSKEDLANWNSDDIQNKEKGYNGTQNTDQLKALLGKGHSAKEVAGVYFAVKDTDGYVTINESGETPVYGRVASLDDQLPEGHKLLAGETTATGIVFNTSGLKGEFTIEEIHEKSSYVGKDGETITDSKAVPVEITLPLVNNDGVVEDAHVYPKNTEEKPKIDKNFVKDKGLEAAEGFENQDLLNVGAEYKNYQEKKATAKAEVGKNIPYEVKTELPAKSNLAEAHWDDKMTEGLTFNKDLKVTIDGKELTADDYTLVEDDRGFSVRLKEETLKDLVNGKDKAVTVVLTYSATVNSNAIADIPEANDVNFFYGNTPSKGTTPVPTKPNDNGEITVEKTWDNGSAWEDGEWADFKLVDANTGEDVKAEDLDQVDGYTFEPKVRLQKDGNHTYTWKGLKKDKQYKVVEVASQTLADAEYRVTEDGKIEVTNHKSTNPKPLNPTEPKVVLGGKKFVKTNQEGTERLAGAEFYVKNAEGKYLVADQKDSAKVTDAKKALDEAVEKYNNLSAKDQAGDEGTRLKNEINEAQEAYNKAFKENAVAYKWEDKADNAVVLVSDAEGKFEITGLEYGTYKLEEKTAPKGYAKLTGEIEFKVEKGSYAGTAEEFKYEVKLEEGETQTYGLQIKNKKVIIPQTGGIGSLIFVVIGIALMSFAFIAYRKNQQEA